MNDYISLLTAIRFRYLEGTRPRYHHPDDFLQEPEKPHSEAFLKAQEEILPLLLSGQ